MGWIGCVHCEKLENDFLAQTCALNAPVQPVLPRVSCSNETLPNAPKHYEMHQNISLWSNGVDRVCSLRKIPMRFHGTNLCIIHQFNPFSTEFRVVTKYYQIHTNTTRRTQTWVSGPMGWIGCVRCEKFWFDFMARTSALIAPVQPVLHRVSCSNETLPNAPKHYEAHQNISLWSNGVDRVCSLRKIPMRFHITNLCIIHQFNPFSTEFCVVTKYYQIHTNTTRRTQTWI